MRLFNARVIESEDCDGKKEQGIFIPIKDNNIKKYRGNYSLNLFVEQMMTNYSHHKSTHKLRIYCDKTFRERMFRRGDEYVPVVGFMNPSNSVTIEQRYVQLYRENKKDKKVYINQPNNTNSDGR